jgi:hypothetical protein
MLRIGKEKVRDESIGPQILCICSEISIIH